jgi:hypothetical protein
MGTGPVVRACCSSYNRRCRRAVTSSGGGQRAAGRASAGHPWYRPCSPVRHTRHGPPPLHEPPRSHHRRRWADDGARGALALPSALTRATAGNSGFETADHLAPHAAIVHVAIRRPVRRGLRSAVHAVAKSLRRCVMPGTPISWAISALSTTTCSTCTRQLRALLEFVSAIGLTAAQLKSLHATIGDPPLSLERHPERGTIIATFVEWVRLRCAARVLAYSGLHWLLDVGRTALALALHCRWAQWMWL